MAEPQSMATIIAAAGWQRADPARKYAIPDDYCERHDREHVCCLCDDSGWVAATRDPRDGRPVVPNIGKIGQVMLLRVLCDCQWNAPRAPFDARRFGFPEKLADVTLATWPGAHNSRPMIEARNYTLSWPPAKPNLVFLGDTGRAKTGLACAIVRAVYELHGVGGRMVTEARLLDRLRASFDDDAVESTDTIVQEYLRAPLLVVDDMGTSKATDWVVDRVFAIVGGRLNASLPTIITANDRTADGSGWARVDARVRSRAGDHSAGIVIGFDGPDYRTRRAG